MKTENAVQRQTTFGITSLVQTALAQSNLSGLSEMLKVIAQSMNAQGCILWQVAPGADFDANPPNGSLFVLTQWFQGNQGSTLHDLPLYYSETGMAVLSQKILSVENVWGDERVYKSDPFLDQAHIKTICSVPVTFLDNVRGALNLYRNVPGPFSEEEVAQAERLASMVPALYQAIRDKVSLNLIQSLDALLHKAELRASSELLSKDKVKNVLHQVCKLISDTFQSVETSIFLEDQFETPDVYELIATTWPREFKKTTYEKNVKQGLAGWVLANAKPIRIFDLAHFERDKEAIRGQYPELTWKDSLTIEPTIRELLNLNADHGLPPLSFMATPIVMGDKVLGIIRCAVTQKGPYYFADRELNLLTLAATRIGHYWNNWISRREALEENRSWQDLIASIGELNSFVHGELIKQAPNEHLIFAESLRVTSSVIKGAEIMDVRLLDDEKRELYFAQIQGKLWSEGSIEEINERRNRRFPIGNGSPPSAGAHVFQTGQSLLISDVGNDPYYSETLLDTNRMIIAPIQIKNEVFGVLDIRTSGKSDFPKHAVTIAELLGQQLGLYRHLAITIGELRQTQVQLSENISVLESLQKQQIQTFEDLKHQLYNPINQAHAKIQLLLKTELPNVKSVLTDEVISESLELSLLAVRGLCAKAKRVSASTGLFAQLAQGETIPVHPKRLSPDYLVKIIVETAMDTKLISDPDNDINFNVDRHSFDILWSKKIEVDLDLLDQAIMNVIDNAAKYSFTRTVVRIYGSLTATGRFHVSISNKGIQLRSEDIHKCIKRGWRSNEALRATAEGSGIGLWIVDNIMKAHGGDLIITATTEGVTKVSLVFPH